MRLTERDYNKILKFYKVKDYKKMTLKSKRESANKILSSKLCGCIKTIKKTQKYKSEKDIIPICKNSVLRKKGLVGRKFTCKKRKSLLLSKLKQTRNRK